MLIDAPNLQVIEDEQLKRGESPYLNFEIYYTARINVASIGKG